MSAVGWLRPTPIWLIVSPSSDLVYLAGYHAHVSERLNALAVPRRGGEPPRGGEP